jgi:hypothetical protein
MSQNPFCEAERVGDEMVCPRCQIAWYVDNPAPPECAYELNLDEDQS